MKKEYRMFWCLGLLFTCLGLIGCKKEKHLATIPAQEAWTVYQTEQVVAYTLDTEGNLYTFEYEEMDSVEELSFHLKKYDVEGKLLFSREMEDTLGSCVKTMAVKDGILYFAPNIYEEGKMYTVLHSYDLETGEMTKEKGFPYFKQVMRILVGEKYIFLLGTSSEHVGSGDSRRYVHTGEKVMYYAPEEDEVLILGIEEPIDIALNPEGHLLLYAHTEEGFCFFLYDVARDAIKTLAKTEEYKMCNMALCGEENEVLYQTVSRGLVVSSFADLKTESELYPEGLYWDNNLCYVNGRVACISQNGQVVQFLLSEVKKENEKIRYIATGMDLSEPYGCGYKMQRINMEEDKFALKVMALDTDFDVCFVNTMYSFSHTMKENGVFYPLNDVPGVQEYLNACFPYVREAATDEDGNIWMLPISVNLPGFVVGEEAQEKGLFSNVMTLEEYCLMPEGVSTTILLQNLLRQYFAKNTSVDTAAFRNMMRLLASYDQNRNGGVSEKDYEYVPYEINYRAYYIRLLGDSAKVYSVPKLSVDAKNIGTCVFLAVNPYSDNLDATLDYLSSFIAYTMRREDAPLFFQNRAVEDTTYEKSLYELYQNGEIGFTLDNDIYEGYEEVFLDITKLETYITETERKLNIYFNE